MEGVPEQVQEVVEDAGAGAARDGERHEHVVAADLATAQLLKVARRLAERVDRRAQRAEHLVGAVAQGGEERGPADGGQLSGAGVQRGDPGFVDPGRQPAHGLFVLRDAQHPGHLG